MAEHQNKHVREAIAYAESRGWTFHKSNARAHTYGKLYCPAANRGGHIVRVHSTPANPEIHARKIRRAVHDCEHSLN